MRNDRDDNPMAIETSMTIQLVKWSPAGGAILAAGGFIMEGEEQKGLIKFFDDEGNHLKNLKLPNCEEVRGLAW